MHKEHEEHFAHQYRLRQAETILRLFREENGRDAETTEELGDFVKSRPDLFPPQTQPEDHNG